MSCVGRWRRLAARSDAAAQLTKRLGPGARPHLLLGEQGEIVALSNGLRPHKDSNYVFTLVQPVLQDRQQ